MKQHYGDPAFPNTGLEIASSSAPLFRHVNLAKYGYVGNAWVEPFLKSTEVKWTGFMFVARLPTEK